MENHSSEFNQQNEEKQVIPALAFSENAIKYLATGAKWAKFVAIVGFVFIGLIVFGGLISGVFFSFMGDQMGMGGFPFPPFLFAFIYLIVALIYFFPIYYVYKFATKAQNAIRMLNSRDIEASILNLKSYFKFMGVLIIVVLAFYFLALIVMIAGFSFFQSQFFQMSQHGMM